MISKGKNSTLFTKWINDRSFYANTNLQSALNLQVQSKKHTLKLFHEAAIRVPAYKDFLKRNKINPQLVKTISNYQQVPQTDKDNYIHKYDVKARCWDGNLEQMHIISTSSGTTGKPIFWPRNLASEIEGAYLHELIFNTLLNVGKQRTLLINGFAIGNWIAGTFTSATVNLVSWKGYPLTLMSPGYSTDAVIEVLTNIADAFEQVILAGHTQFLKDVIDECIDRGTRLNKLSLRLLGTGQAITERWREHIIDKVGSDNIYHTFINLYGSADAALMGFESPNSIYFRRIITDNQQLASEIFKSDRVPSIYNFDPRLIFFQQENNELVITKNYGCPLIRYNIKDEGGVISAKDLSSFFPSGNQKQLCTYKWQLPYVYLYGRDKFMVKIYGANVYTEHVQYALDHKHLKDYITGRFKLEIIDDENNNPVLYCRVELLKGNLGAKNMVLKIKDIFVEELSKRNSEYRYVLNELGDKVKPVIVIHEHGDEEHFSRHKFIKTA